MPTIDEVIKLLSKNLNSSNYTASNFKMQLKAARMIFRNERLTRSQYKKLETIIDDLQDKVKDVEEMNILVDAVKRESGLPTSDEITKSVIKWSLGILDSDIDTVAELESAFIGGISSTKIAGIHELCKDEGLFKIPFSVTDFINCFDLNKANQVYPNFSSQKEFVYILSKIDDSQGGIPLLAKIAKARFLIMSFGSVRTRLNNGTVQIPIEFGKKVNKIINS